MKTLNDILIIHTGLSFTPLEKFYILSIVGCLFMCYFAYISSRRKIHRPLRRTLGSVYFFSSLLFFSNANKVYYGRELGFMGSNIVLILLVTILSFILILVVSNKDSGNYA